MTLISLAAAVVGLIGYTVPAQVATVKPAASLAGDYVEARTEAVFAGPCHVNGEVMSTGRDAVMAWQFNSGVRIMAAVASPRNLGDNAAPRQSEIVIDDSSATPGQAGAALDAVEKREVAALGKIVSVRHGRVTFSHVDREYQVESPGFAALDITGMPNDECCKQPNLVWFAPLAHVSGRKVGYTVNAEYTAGTVGASWQRTDENGAFYGSFAY
jgi:hypothetical protein